MRDNLEELALKIIEEAAEVLETKEILERLEGNIKDITRTKVFARLNNLRGDGLIRGKFVGPGKGVWIWWSSSFSNGNGNRGEHD
jgi:hypothetical protein